ncbi:hypothetical protein J2Y61_000994 [Asticcacaulis sp. BE141]|nr:hypothetical protein [Asticcacaulis sp. BE141]
MPPIAVDWWIIGSAAMVLCGVETEAKDVDLFASEATIAKVLERLRLDPLPPSNDPLFRSTVFAVHQPLGGVPVEFMGGFEVRSGGGWQPLKLHTRRRIETAKGPVVVPELSEQIAVLELFGRDKDLRRADLIRKFLAQNSGWRAL